MRVLTAAASAAAIALAFGYVQPANAALLSISGGSDYSVTASNDLIPTPNASLQALVPGGGVIDDADDSGLFGGGGAQLSTTANNVKLTYNYIGSVAGAINSFTAGGGSFVTPGLWENTGGDSAAQASFDVVQASADAVDFAFFTSLGGSVGNVTGNFVAGGAEPNFMMAYLEDLGGGNWEITDMATDVVLILLDDGGLTADGDYDDLGVIAIASVPIPAALPLLGTALAGLGLMTWRRKSAA